jgi:hypothetical protein
MNVTYTLEGIHVPLKHARGLEGTFISHVVTYIYSSGNVDSGVYTTAVR